MIIPKSEWDVLSNRPAYFNWDSEELFEQFFENNLRKLDDSLKTSIICSSKSQFQHTNSLILDLRAQVYISHQN